MRIRLFNGLKSARTGQAAPISPRKRLSAWRRGFSGWSWLTYDLDRNDPDHYLPDTAMPRISKVNGAAGRTLLRNKLAFSSVVGNELRAPAVLGIVDGGRIVSLRDDFRVVDTAGLLKYCSRVGGVVVKPVDSSEGRQVISLEVVDDRPLLDKAPADAALVQDRFGRMDGFLITELVGQADYAARIFPDAVNTMRIITMIDPDDDEPFIAASVHRFGTRRSAPTDNAARGGLWGSIDPQTGELGALSATWTYRHGAFVEYARHPDTDEQVEGVKVPAWPEVTDFILDAVRKYPFWRYVAWDALVADEGVRILEGNHAGNLAAQRENPYLADPRIVRFLRYHDVVGPKNRSR